MILKICLLEAKEVDNLVILTAVFEVSKDGYEECELRDEKLIGVCQTPKQQSSISIVFRDFSPLPGALEFKPGESYYIISKFHIAIYFSLCQDCLFTG